MASNGYLMDLKDLEGIDFSRKPWVQSSIPRLSVLNHNFTARDQESSQMLDIIYAHTTYDPGSIGAYAGIHEYIYMAMSYANIFASYSAARKRPVEKAIDKVCDGIESHYGG